MSNPPELTSDQKLWLSNEANLHFQTHLCLLSETSDFTKAPAFQLCTGFYQSHYIVLTVTKKQTNCKNIFLMGLPQNDFAFILKLNIIL